MSYEITATRKRPQDFAHLMGQEFVVETIRSSIENQTIAHAYLFSGPRGVGKTSSARILARSLNCVNGPTIEPCGECSSCKEIKTSTSIDVIEIDGASHTGVNDIREIKDEVRFPPSNSRYKIYIIDEVHMLSNNAFNALLKTIEEPPEYIIFIFATTEIHKVPQTIKSRCQQFHFKLISQQKVEALLKENCQELEISFDEAGIQWIAQQSTGSLRDAYTLFDQVAAFSNKEINIEKIRTNLGLLSIEQINTLMQNIVQSNVKATLEISNAILDQGVAIDTFLTDLGEYFRQLLLLKSGITQDSLLNIANKRPSNDIVETLSLVQIEHALNLLLKLFRDLRYSLNERTEVDLFLAKLCQLPHYLSKQELMKKLNAMQSFMLGEDVKPDFISAWQKKKL